MKVKPHLALDGYKTGHIFQYPEKTEFVYSNLTARSATHAKMPKSFDNKTVFFGLQGFIKDFLINTWNEGFFNRPKEEVVAEYKRRMDNYLGKDSVPVDHIADLHDLGFLPLIIKALPEGSRVDIKVPYLVFCNTDSRFFWLTNYIETVLSNELWKPITVATIAYEYRRILDKFVEMTGSNAGFADFQLHDFSMRGDSGVVASHTTGAAHLISAGYGTDTLPGIEYLEEFYGANSDTELVGCSVPATEHSVMCMGGLDDEIGTIRRLITDIYPSGIVSIVSDTWDFWKVITDYSVQLKPEIMSRVPNALGQAKVVFRPDSGDPVYIVSGYKYVDLEGIEPKNFADEVLDNDAELVKYEGKYYRCGLSDSKNGFDDILRIDMSQEYSEAEVKGAVECLWDIFGGTETDKGYRTLDSHVGLIYGDSITLERCEQILQRLADKGFAADNIVFGIGSFTYQYITRDTFGMAVKATYGMVNGVGRELEKDPKTGDGIKKSAKGLLRVTKEGGNFVLHDRQEVNNNLEDELQTVFYNGKMFNYQTLSDIRSLVKPS